jgi:putative transposase
MHNVGADLLERPSAMSCSRSTHFPTIFHARSAIEAWRIDYNEFRPHTALDGLTPAEFIEHHRITSNSRSAAA